MRIAVLTLDSLASHRAVRSFIETHHADIVLVGASCRLQSARRVLREGLRHVMHSGLAFNAYLFVNLTLPRLATAWRPHTAPQSLRALCGRMNIPFVPVVDVNGPDFHRDLAASGAELIVTCYFDQILKAHTHAAPRYGAINVHSAMLPDNRGPFPVLHGWLDSPPNLGVTVHRIDDGIDTGVILAQEAVQPLAGETLTRLTSRLHERGMMLVSALLPQFADGTLEGRSQTGGSYEGFPSRGIVRRLRRIGVRLFDGRDLRTALDTAITT